MKLNDEQARSAESYIEDRMRSNVAQYASTPEMPGIDKIRAYLTYENDAPLTERVQLKLVDPAMLILRHLNTPQSPKTCRANATNPACMYFKAATTEDLRLALNTILKDCTVEFEQVAR